MTWTKGTFEMVAKVLRERIEDAQDIHTAEASMYPRIACVTEIARHFANEFTASNPRFDRARFLKACGLE
jgi:hypothetical protein